MAAKCVVTGCRQPVIWQSVQTFGKRGTILTCGCHRPGLNAYIRKDGKPMPTFYVTTPYVGPIPSVNDAQSAEAFVRWCARTIGMGFHPDTPVASYDPPFAAIDAVAIQSRLDGIEEFDLCDVYAIGADEFERMVREGDE
jgi:hypothetical protein